MYGKNVMGGYADKLSYEERWNVVHWIRALQAKEAGKDYNEKINTLNNTSTPMASIKQVAKIEDSHSSNHGVEIHHDGTGHEHGAGHHEGGHIDGEHHEGNGHDHGHEH